MSTPKKTQKKGTSKNKGSGSKAGAKGKKTKSSSSSSVAQESTPKAVVKKAKKSSKAAFRKSPLGRYNAVQAILSQYLRENNIKSGRTFSEMSHQLYQMTKGDPLKYVQQNIDAIYQQRLHKRPLSVTFPDSIEFYAFLQTIQLPEFDDVVVSYDFNDGVEQYSSSGDRDSVSSDFHASGLYKYLRQNYNGSPPNNALFKVAETDNRTFVKYQIQTFNLPSGAAGVDEPPKSPESGSAGPQVGRSGPQAGEGTIQQQIELEKAKQETERLRIETLKQVQNLLDKGFTKQEIMQILGK